MFGAFPQGSRDMAVNESSARYIRSSFKSLTSTFLQNLPVLGDGLRKLGPTAAEASRPKDQTFHRPNSSERGLLKLILESSSVANKLRSFLQ